MLLRIDLQFEPDHIWPRRQQSGRRNQPRVLSCSALVPDLCCRGEDFFHPHPYIIVQIMIFRQKTRSRCVGDNALPGLLENLVGHCQAQKPLQINNIETAFLRDCLERSLFANWKALWNIESIYGLKTDCIIGLKTQHMINDEGGTSSSGAGSWRGSHRRAHQ